MSLSELTVPSHSPHPSRSEGPRQKEGDLANLLWKALTSRPARHHYQRIAQVTGEQWREAGFIVYGSRNARPHVSRLVESKGPAHGRALLSATEELLMYESLDWEGLCDASSANAEEHPRIRRDLLFRLHSHPQGHDDARVEDWLRPSSTDLETWELANAVNPGMVEAVAVVTTHQLKLLLYRHRPGQSLVTYYQQLEGNEAQNQVVRVLKASRLEVATIVYQLTSQRFAPGSRSAFDQLFA